MFSPCLWFLTPHLGVLSRHWQSIRSSSESFWGESGGNLNNPDVQPIPRGSRVHQMRGGGPLDIKDLRVLWFCSRFVPVKESSLSLDVDPDALSSCLVLSKSNQTELESNPNSILFLAGNQIMLIRTCWNTEKFHLCLFGQMLSSLRLCEEELLSPAPWWDLRPQRQHSWRLFTFFTSLLLHEMERSAALRRLWTLFSWRTTDQKSLPLETFCCVQSTTVCD